MTDIKQISPNELEALLNEKKALLIDVRDNKEHLAEAIPGATNIPMAELALNIDRLNSANGSLVLQCQSGKRSMMACNELLKLGLKSTLWNLEGGILAWKAQQLPTESGTKSQ